MNLSLRTAALLAALPSVLFAVYAPIPEQEQGKALSFRLGASISHDSNIFGGATDEIDSMVYSFKPSFSFNNSVTDQTFVSLGYELAVDHFEDRPTKQTLTSHTINARVAHAFSKDTNIDVSDNYLINKNPQSLLAGVPLNTDQSSKVNGFNIRYTTSLGQKTGAVVKYRNADFAYDNNVLASRLDRNEHLAGAELSFAFLPETKLIGEYRYLDVNYGAGADTKNKRSHYLMGGADHKPNEKTTLTGRLGIEDRSRDSESDTTSPYVELSARYAYSEDSYLSAGYAFLIEESSDTIRFTDTEVNRFFVNVQYKLSALITASGSLTFEPSSLQARAGGTDLDEETTRFGLALNWLPNRNWLVGATLDIDKVDSDDPSRGQDRTRFGVNARFSF